MTKPETLPDELFKLVATPHPRGPFLFVLAGLPGLGKSTAARWLCCGYRSAIMESDRIWELVCPYGYDKNFGATGYIVMTSLVGAWLGQQIDAVVDSTAVTRKHRQRFVEMAANFDAPAYCLYFPPDVEESIRRRAGDPEVSPENQRVPEDSIRSMAERWERPSVEEGFRAVFEMQPVGS